MSPMNTNQHKDYQTVLEEQTPLVCDDVVENNSSINRHLTLLSVGVVFAVFVAMTGHMSHATTARTIADLQATLAAHEVDISAAAFTTSVVQSTPLLGGAAGTKGEHEQCYANSECGSKRCEDKRYAFCAGPAPVCQGFNKCKYKFHLQLESGGGDCAGIGKQDGSVIALQRKCNNVPGCLGFNTNGWLKCKFKPYDEWTPFTDRSISGTYVKEFA